MSRIDFVTGAPEKYAHLVEALATVPERLRDALAGRSAGDLPRQAQEGWSAVRIMQHMLLYAARNGVFIHQMGTMTDPIRRPFEEAEAEAYPTDPQRLADMIEREIGQTVAFLSHLPDASWGRAGLLPAGRRSLREQVRLHTEHMDEHIAQIQATAGP
ncbi:MAG: DinB family protein [Dehalococcoidia bacterium]|nr:DinB family protein [Dehalococcoidia bacterium]